MLVELSTVIMNTADYKSLQMAIKVVNVSSDGKKNYT